MVGLKAWLVMEMDMSWVLIFLCEGGVVASWMGFS
jgi:hypothetical protein